MDEEPAEAPVYPRLGYVVQWRGLTPGHLWPIGLVMIVLLYPIMCIEALHGAVVPIFALGFALLVGVIIVQWRRPPEYIHQAFQKLTTARHYSPFVNDNTDVEFPFSQEDLDPSAKD